MKKPSQDRSDCKCWVDPYTMASESKVLISVSVSVEFWKKLHQQIKAQSKRLSSKHNAELKTMLDLIVKSGKQFK